MFLLCSLFVQLTWSPIPISFDGICSHHFAATWGKNRFACYKAVFIQTWSLWLPVYLNNNDEKPYVESVVAWAVTNRNETSWKLEGQLGTAHLHGNHDVAKTSFLTRQCNRFSVFGPTDFRGRWKPMTPTDWWLEKKGLPFFWSATMMYTKRERKLCPLLRLPCLKLT